MLSSHSHRLGRKALLLLLLLAAAGCTLRHETKASRNASTATPSATVVATIPAPSPMPTATAPPSPTTTPSPEATLTPAPTFTPTATEAVAFAGQCSSAVEGAQPCLYDVGVTKYQGKQVYRYVFANIPYPESAFVEINGVRLVCTHTSEYPQRIYCVGVVPAVYPVQLVLGWVDAQGRHVSVVVSPDVVRAMHLPLGAPATSTPTPSPSHTPLPTCTFTPTPITPTFTPTPITPTPTFTPITPSPTPTPITPTPTFTPDVG